MKIETLTRPGLIALGMVGIAATAVLGFAAGVAVTRDPEAVRRTARRVAHAAALTLERGALMAAQAREHVGDLWAEARETAVSAVDDADFTRAAAGAAQPPRGAAAATPSAKAKPAASAPTKKPARKRAARPRKTQASSPAQARTAGDGAAGG
ncbi:MAG: hypothetical protein H7Z19_23855 [Chitinophagaceae bacterium]|nr:hypothetical protein [Rubrivivax sp.]